MSNRIVISRDSCSNFTIANPKRYVIDFDKISSFEELKMLVSILYKSLNVVVQDDSIYYEQLKDYLKDCRELS